jgi:signal transduction histidine kinase
VQILQRVPNDLDRVRRATATIDRQASQLVRLIDALLDVARISQGLVELDVAPRSVASIVDGALDVVRESLQKTGHEIVVEHEAGDAVVLVDALRAEQILVNLLSNALKYSLPRTRVAIRSWRDGDVARIAVTDQGQGIPPEFLAEIFTMFARPGLEARSRISGMGVGLALARQLAEQQGGSIDVASEGRGRGATFTVAFPLAERPRDVIAA